MIAELELYKNGKMPYLGDLMQIGKYQFHATRTTTDLLDQSQYGRNYIPKCQNKTKLAIIHLPPLPSTSTEHLGVH